MRCRDAERLISRSLDGDITAREALELRAHLTCCRACSVLHSDLTRLQDMLRRAPASPAPTDFELAVRQRLARRSTPIRHLAGNGLKVRLAVAVLSVVLCACAMGLVWDRHRQQQESEAELADLEEATRAQTFVLTAYDPLGDVALVRLGVQEPGVHDE